MISLKLGAGLAVVALTIAIGATWAGARITDAEAAQAAVLPSVEIDPIIIPSPASTSKKIHHADHGRRARRGNQFYHVAPGMTFSKAHPK